MSILDKFVSLSRQLMPTGRAFRMYSDSNSERLHKALAITESKLYTDTKSTLSSLLPDNDNFTADDATDWERRLGLIYSPSVDLADRKLAIARKLASPGINPARSAAKWLEYQLQAAGFAVYVHENIVALYPSGYERATPGEYNPALLLDLEHGEIEHGEIEHGGYYSYIVANSIYNSEDVANFNAITDYATSFFIGGAVYGSYANVPSIRETEFRQLILVQKQVQSIAFGFINFT